MNKIAYGVLSLYTGFMAMQIGYGYTRGTGTAGTQACWSDTRTLDSCGASESIDGAGTANFIPKFSDANTLTNSAITNTSTDISASVTGQIEFVANNAVSNSSGLVLYTPPTAGTSGDILKGFYLPLAMNGSDTVNAALFSSSNANHTGTGNTYNIVATAAITGDANSNLNGLSIGALTGTTGAASEVEAAINFGTGWDADLYKPSGAMVIDGDITIGTNDVDDIVFNGPIEFKVFREDFSPIDSYPFAGGAWAEFTVADTGVNGILGRQLFMELRYEQAFAGTFVPVDGTGYFFVELDDVDNEGVDLSFGGTRASGANVRYQGGFWDEDISSSTYCEASVLITDVSETDSFYFGWTIKENYIDAGVWATGNTFAYFSIDSTDGDLDISTQLNASGGVEEDDVGTDFADTNEKVLRVTLSADSVTFTLDGVAVTQTNAVLNADNGDQMVCGMGWLNSAGDGTPDPDIKINYVEIGVSQ